MLVLLPPLQLVLHARVSVPPSGHQVVGLRRNAGIVLNLWLMLGVVVLLVIIIVLLLLLLLLLRIAIADSGVVAATAAATTVMTRDGGIVGIVNVSGTTATTGIRIPNRRNVCMRVRCGLLQLHSGSASKIGIRLFLLSVSIGGLALGGIASLLVRIAVTIAVVR